MDEDCFQKQVGDAKAVPATISLSGGRASFVGPSLDLAPHANSAAVVAIALDAPFWLSLAAADGRPLPPQAVQAALISPGRLHQVQASGSMLFLYLDAMSDDHVAMARLDLLAGRAALLADREALFDVDRACEALGVPKRPVGDPRIVTVVRRIDERPQDFAGIADAARMAGLSSSRFQRLFRQEVGMPFRRYRLWRRMAQVVRALQCGESLTQAAYAAGFASSAHLSASFRAMFGLAPSQLVALGVEIRG